MTGTGTVRSGQEHDKGLLVGRAEAVTRATLKQYRHSDAVTDLLELLGRPYSLTIDAAGARLPIPL